MNETSTQAPEYSVIIHKRFKFNEIYKDTEKRNELIKYFSSGCYQHGVYFHYYDNSNVPFYIGQNTKGTILGRVESEIGEKGEYMSGYHWILRHKDDLEKYKILECFTNEFISKRHKKVFDIADKAFYQGPGPQISKDIEKQKDFKTIVAVVQEFINKITTSFGFVVDNKGDINKQVAINDVETTLQQKLIKYCIRKNGSYCTDNKYTNWVGDGRKDGRPDAIVNVENSFSPDEEWLKY